MFNWLLFTNNWTDSPDVRLGSSKEFHHSSLFLFKLTGNWTYLETHSEHITDR